MPETDMFLHWKGDEIMAAAEQVLTLPKTKSEKMGFFARQWDEVKAIWNDEIQCVPTAEGRKQLEFMGKTDFSTWSAEDISELGYLCEYKRVKR